MKKNFTLSVPNPCHEKWEQFNPTKLGGFCSNCQKEVIDFTSWGEDQIKSYFKNRSQSACGRFHPTQLKNYTLTEVPKFNFLRWTFVPLISLVIVFFSRNAQAQGDGKAKIERLLTRGESKLITGDTVRIKVVKGIVKSTEDQSILPGVNVFLKGTAIGTSTDFDGRFSITIQDPGPDDILVFSFIGLQTVERNIYEINELSTMMSLDVTQLGGYEIKVSPIRRVWWTIKDLFSRD